jgi:hypothetical protein
MPLELHLKNKVRGNQINFKISVILGFILVGYQKTQYSNVQPKLNPLKTNT